MKVVWTPNAKEDYLYWSKADQKVLGWINDLIRDIQRDPFKGLGKPEPLKHHLQGYWSRRITLEDRLVYRVSGKGDTRQVEIIQCRYHY
ncbi:MAG TPA: Txe/YoeB family addiction module toxin [Xanthobacteraceae bacterium]|nr:Txe/YoeB family addiction module toxin [Xanthobacteraceae bacterium]